MFSYPEPDIILADLGDKFLSALVRAVTEARQDVDEMRAWQPSWFPRMHSRTLANLIHDRIWDRIVSAIEDDPNIAVVDRGVIRELLVGLALRTRLKRHRDKDLIASYETPAALLFYQQSGQYVITGDVETTLAVGYRWDDELNRIGAAVVSYRDGKDNPIWSVELEEPQAGSVVTWRPVAEPDLPLVHFDDDSTGQADAAADDEL